MSILVNFPQNRWLNLQNSPPHSHVCPWHIALDTPFAEPGPAPSSGLAHAAVVAAGVRSPFLRASVCVASPVSCITHVNVFSLWVPWEFPPCRRGSVSPHRDGACAGPEGRENFSLEVIFYRGWFWVYSVFSETSVTWMLDFLNYFFTFCLFVNVLAFSLAADASSLAVIFVRVTRAAADRVGFSPPSTGRSRPPVLISR